MRVTEDWPAATATTAYSEAHGCVLVRVCFVRVCVRIMGVCACVYGGEERDSERDSMCVYARVRVHAHVLEEKEAANRLVHTSTLSHTPRRRERGAQTHASTPTQTARANESKHI